MPTQRAPEILDRIVTRDSLPVFMAERGYQTMVEIGTWKGEFAKCILLGWAGHLTCIDPWQNYDASEYLDGCLQGGGGPAFDMDVCYEETKARLAPFVAQNRCTIYRGTSSAISTLFTHESFDACYLDGNHDYTHVRDDIATWWPRVKSGGLFGGHDAYSRNDAFQRADVMNAIWDFSEVIGVRPHVCPDSSWFFIKP